MLKLRTIGLKWKWTGKPITTFLISYLSSCVSGGNVIYETMFNSHSKLLRINGFPFSWGSNLSAIGRLCSSKQWANLCLSQTLYGSQWRLCFYSLLITHLKSTQLSINPSSLPLISAAIYSSCRCSGRSAISRYSVMWHKYWQKGDSPFSPKDLDSESGGEKW